MYKHPVFFTIWLRRPDDTRYPDLVKFVKTTLGAGAHVLLATRKGGHSITVKNEKSNRYETFRMGSCLYLEAWSPREMTRLQVEYGSEGEFPMYKGSADTEERETGKDNTREKCLYVQGLLEQYTTEVKDKIFDQFGYLGIHIVAKTEIEVVGNVPVDKEERDSKYPRKGFFSKTNKAQLEGHFAMLDDNQFAEMLVGEIV